MLNRYLLIQVLIFSFDGSAESILGRLI